MDQAQNILITGAAGYIGGSVLADFASREDGAIAGAKLHAVVRSDNQVEALSEIGVNIIKLELSDGAGVAAAIQDNKIDIVVHTANSYDQSLISNLLKGLRRRRAETGKPVYFVHTSVTTWYSDVAGWPYGRVKDSDPIYEKEKGLDIPHPIREANVFVVDKAKECGVTSFHILVPNVYGVGGGQGRKVSILIPALIKASIALKKVHKFDTDGYPPGAHVSDLVDLYGAIIEHILQDQAIPSGRDGYYSAQAHKLPWWAYMEALAKSLHARGLVVDSELATWPSDAAAAQALRFPQAYIRAMGIASGDIEPVNSYRLGWKPKWNEQMFLNHADDEVQAVLDLGNVETSLFDKLLNTATD